MRDCIPRMPHADPSLGDSARHGAYAQKRKSKRPIGPRACGDPRSFCAHPQILREMQAQPKTIADYKKALARLGVPLPAGTTKKADYEALWLSAATKKAASPPLKPRFVNPNVPLSMQEANLRAATCPSTFTQPPSTPATPAFELPEYSFASAPVEDASSSPPQVMDDHWLPAAPSAEVPCAEEARTLQRESPKPRSRVHSSSKGATVTSLVAALLVALGGGGYWMLPQCNLETGVSEPVGLIMAQITEEAADFIAPVAAVEIASIAEAAPAAAADDNFEKASEDKAEDNAEDNAEDKVDDKADDKAEKAPEEAPEDKVEDNAEANAEDNAEDNAENNVENKAEDNAEKAAKEAKEVPALAVTAVGPSAIDHAVDEEPAIATVPDDDPEETQTTTSDEAIELRSPEGRDDAFSAGKSASIAMAVAIVRAVSAAAHAGFVMCSEAAGWAAQAVARSESVQWLAAAATECAWALLRAFVSAGLVFGAYVLRWVAQLLQHGLPWIAQTAPVAARGLISIVILRPELLGAAIAMLGSLSCFHRAYLWHRRWREARRAQRAAQVDAAARWVIGELKAHSERWTPISGGCTPIAPSDLRARVPHAVLADGSLWGRVAARVRSDMSVRVVPGSHDGISAEEGWLYVIGAAAVQALISPSAGLRSPTCAFSPLLGGTPKTSAFAATSAFSPMLPSRVATPRPIAPAA